MKALTLRQPWASLMALGQKTIETRSWPTKHRGPLIIHAGKGFDPIERIYALSTPFYESLGRPRCADDLPLGHGLCIVNLIGCYKTNELHKLAFALGRKPDVKEIQFGNFAEGRYAWLTEFVRPLTEDEAIPGRGFHRGLWEYDPSDRP